VSVPELAPELVESAGELRQEHAERSDQSRHIAESLQLDLK
jgi:hypothetical protein